MSTTKGNQGEALATDFLARDGWTIVERNWRNNHAEIDIIMSKNDLLVFVEVKTRGTDTPESPEQAVSKRKQGHLIRAASAYLEQSDFEGEVRFDIVAIRISEQTTDIRHIEDAFFPVP